MISGTVHWFWLKTKVFNQNQCTVPEIITILQDSTNSMRNLHQRNPLSKQKCVLRKCCGVSQKQWMLELSNLCHCVQHPWKLTSRDYWSSRNTRKPLSELKMYFVKMPWGISETVNARAFITFAIVFSNPWKLTSRDYWSSSNTRKPLSELKHVFRKCSGVSQKQWMLELSNLCHCVQCPWKLTSREFWSSRNDSKPLSKHKCIWWKYCGVSQKQWMLELSNLCHCVQHPWKLTSRDYWSSRNTRKPLSQQKYSLRKCCGVSHKWWVLELSNLCHCVQQPWKPTSRDYWSSRNERKTLSKHKCILWKHAVGYLRNSEC